MKILDRYILLSYLKTFFSVFVILMFIFILQTVWLYIGELAGKDIDFSIILKFLWFALPKLIPLVLPLTILVTSLMVFGSFSEKYEFAAMKSTGISLQRAMRSLMFFIIGLAITAFFFANNVIPASEYKWRNLRINISKASPSMAIVEGQFSSIGDDFNIKVAEKYGDKKQYLRNVVIHRKNPDKPTKNTIVVIAKEGELASKEGSNTLSLILKDGNYYEDIQLKNSIKQRNQPFVKSEFEEYILNIDLTELNDTDIDKKNEFSNHNMLNIGELYTELDTLSKAYSKDIKLFGENMYFRTGINRFRDTSAARIKQNLDTVYSRALDPFNSKQQSGILSAAIDNTKGTLQSIKSKKAEFQLKVKRLNKHEIALHEKYVLAIACIILFFVGAPLGAIIRKGGLGLPMVIAIVMFLTYHFIGIFAKNSAEDDSLHPLIASWLSTLIMLPLSVWLTYRATTDQGIIDMDTFVMRFKKLFGKKNAEVLDSSEKKQFFLTQQEKALVLSRNQDQLKDIVKNYKQYEYSEGVRLAAIERLEEQGFSEDYLKISGNFENKKYNEAQDIFKSFYKRSQYALVFLSISILSTIIYITIIATQSFTSLNFLLNSISYVPFITGLLFYIAIIRAMFSHNKFNSKIGKKNEISSWIIVWITGLVSYVFMHFYFKKNMEEQLNTIK